MNIIGEHTDYNAGLVLPMAIDRGVTATVSEADETALLIESAQFPDEIATLDWAELAPGAVAGWAAYIAGAVWAVRRAVDGGSTGLRVQVDSDVPLGAGLSSSAAVECAVGAAVAEWWGLALPPRELARLAQRAENEFVGVPTGSMDQVASAMGSEGAALLFDVQRDTVERVPVEVAAVGLTFVVIDTRAHHALVDGGYANRRTSCEAAAAVLGIRSLREVPDLDDALKRLDDDIQRARVRHVVTENARVTAAVEAMRAGDFRRLGALMDESHTSLRDDFAVSCAELDVAVEAARSAGAWGARMTGGGFGGSVIALVPTANVDAVAAAAEEEFASFGWRSPRTWIVSAAAGARVVTVDHERE